MPLAKQAVYSGLVALTALSTVTAVSSSAASKAKPKLAGCSSWTDPAGDATTEGVPGSSDPALDITNVLVRTTASTVTAELSIPDYKQQPRAGTGTKLEFGFTVAGHPVYLYYNDSSTRSAQENLFYQSGVYVDAARVKGSETLVTETVAAGKVTLAIGLKDLAGAVGTKITPATLASGAEARSFSTVPGIKFGADKATAPDSLKFGLSSACK